MECLSAAKIEEESTSQIRKLTFARNSPSWICKSVPQTPQALTLIWKIPQFQQPTNTSDDVWDRISVDLPYQNVVVAELGKWNVHYAVLFWLGVPRAVSAVALLVFKRVTDDRTAGVHMEDDKAIKKHQQLKAHNSEHKSELNLPEGLHGLRQLGTHCESELQNCP